MKSLLYAEGGDGIGTGHLNRIVNLIENFQIKDDFICCYENIVQKSFYDDKNISSISLKELNNNHFFKYFFIDTKKDRSDLLHVLKGKYQKLVVIDNTTKLTNNADICITPSYYSKNEEILIKNTQFRSGYKNLILHPSINEFHWDPKGYKLISFGGEDPNNLTLMTLNILDSINETNNTKVILGPNYKHNRNEIFKFIDEKDIIKNPKNIYQIFSKSSYVITALGVTLQELFKIGVPALLIANFYEDGIEFEAIEKSAIKYMGRNFINILGYYKDVNKDIYREMHDRAISYENNEINIEFSEIGLNIRNLNQFLNINI